MRRNAAPLVATDRDEILAGIQILLAALTASSEVLSKRGLSWGREIIVNVEQDVRSQLQCHGVATQQLRLVEEILDYGELNLYKIGQALVRIEALQHSLWPADRSLAVQAAVDRVRHEIAPDPVVVTDDLDNLMISAPTRYSEHEDVYSAADSSYNSGNPKSVDWTRPCLKARAFIFISAVVTPGKFAALREDGLSNVGDAYVTRNRADGQPLKGRALHRTQVAYARGLVLGGMKTRAVDLVTSKIYRRIGA